VAVIALQLTCPALDFPLVTVADVRRCVVE
jgi:hypothetical protein